MRKSAVVASILLMISIGFVPIVLMSCSNEIPVYTVRFDSLGGNAIEPIEALKNSKLNEPSTPSKTGYEFGGWYKDNSYSERWVFSRDMVRSDMTLYAKWNAHTYAVTYNGNGQSTGTAPPTQTKKHGESLALSTNSGTLQRNGYRFGGWNTQSDGFGTNYVSGTLYETDAEILLYAKWIAEEYNVTLNKQGGNSGSNSITATYDSAMPSATAPIKNGYLFDGYYDQIDGGTQYYSSTMASSKVWDKNGSSNLYAKWTPAYTVSFNSQGGGSVSSLEGVRQGSRIGEPAAPTRNGYAFDGWFKDSSCVAAWDFDVETINSNITLYAKWVVAYTVEFDSQGGGNIAALEGIRQGSKITAPTAPTNSGYVFQGWYKDSDYTTEWDFSVDIVDSDITLYAKWLVVLYTVNYDSQGGTDVGSVENILYGTKITEPVSPVKSKYVFGGWYRDSSYDQRYYFTTDVVTSSMILHAKWVPPHSVSFDSQGGSPVAQITETIHGDVIPEPEVPSKNGYTFGGWYKQSNCLEQWNFDTELVTSDITLYAKWFPPYTISFDSQGGSIVDEIADVTHGDVISEPVAPNKSGYAFDGWYRQSSCVNHWNFGTDAVTSDVILYAKWIVLHLASFDSRGGSGVEAIEIGNGRKLVEPTDPSRPGYTFAGWYKEFAYINQWDFNLDAVISSRTLYAKWNGNNYTVSFNIQGGSSPSPASKSVINDQVYGDLPTVTRSGYAFDGWWTGTNGTGIQILASTVVSITSNQMLFAKWIPLYTITYQLNDGTNDEDNPATYAANSRTINLQEPTKDGFIFGGWYATPGFSGGQITQIPQGSSGNKTLYAKWDISLILVEGGVFQMGGGSLSASPEHSVMVDDFYMGTYEVTQDIYEQVMGINPSYNKGARLPVENVSWYDAVVFANALSQRDGFEEVYTIDGEIVNCDWSKIGYRLPTEAEWEYAGGGGALSKGYIYAGSNLVEDVAWYGYNSGNRPHDVGTKKANELGLFDMSGNVWEWCWDWFESYIYTVQSNPTGPESGTARVTRGGSFVYDSTGLTVSYRSWSRPSEANGGLGFRLTLPAY